MECVKGSWQQNMSASAKRWGPCRDKSLTEVEVPVAVGDINDALSEVEALRGEVDRLRDELAAERASGRYNRRHYDDLRLTAAGEAAERRRERLTTMRRALVQIAAHGCRIRPSCIDGGWLDRCPACTATLALRHRKAGAA